MTNKYLALVLCLFAVTFQAKAQEHKHCGNVEAQEALLKAHPELIEKIRLSELASEKAAKEYVAKPTRVNRTIPVVFHIIHNNGPENISDAQIIDAMKRINDDFHKTNTDFGNTIPLFDTIAADVQLDFKLATIDPQGNCTNGIDRIESYKTYFSDDKSKLNPWNPNIYLNIWVANSIGKSGTAAYAYKPATGINIPQYDGIICLYDYVGSIGTSTLNYMHTLSHEIGHWLSLDHVWGGTNLPGVACGDDGVSDTPITKGHQNVCPLTFPSAADCNPLIIENSQNFMDYSYCSTMFTKGQKGKMDVALADVSSIRRLLYTPQAMTATGCLLAVPVCKPRANFKANQTIVCINQDVTLNATSWGAATIAHTWKSPDGTFTSTSANTTKVKFTTSGWKEIKLVASGSGGADSLTRSQFIYVRDNAQTEDPTQTETFNNQANKDKWILSNNFKNYFKFSFTDSYGLWGTNSIYFNAYDDRPANQKTTLSPGGDVDDIITPTYNLTAAAPNNKFFNFYMANAALDGFTLADSLNIYASKDCGKTWVLLKSLVGPALHNNGWLANTPFFPTLAEDWKPVAISIPTTMITSATIFKLQFRASDLSNNLFLDNFNCSTFPSSIDDVNATSSNQLVVYPNPAQNKVQFLIKNKVQANTKYKVTNALGLTMNEGIVKENSLGNVVWDVDCSAYANGLYLISIADSHSSITKKFVVQK
jgi:hypothetical protein